MTSGSVLLRAKSKIWLAAMMSVLAALVLAALLMQRSFGLTALSDIIQSLLLLSATASFIPLALRSQGRLRLFWTLIAMGVGLWMSYQLLWTYYEVFLRQSVPGLFDGDIILFLHLVPLTAALALRPHIPRDEYAARLGRLDFALLMVWWFYLYALIVMPWQYVAPDVAAYSRNLNAVYLAEKLAFLVVLVVCWLGSNGQWRKLYGNLFGMGVCYAASSYVANWALARNLYYSGSLYDIPLGVAMAWLTWIGLSTEAQAPASDAREVSTVYGVWVARCSMIAVFSLPLFAAWSMSSSAPAHIHYFRLVLTLAAAFVMGLMVLVRQYLLDRELTHLLNRSQESFDGLKRLQAQIVQSEKLASIGQLVGGAAHELNNPITALLGYSDLLQSSPLTPEQQPLAAKIGQHVRRTKSLVASLISFAGQAPASRTLIDLNAMARTAIKLTQSQWQTLKIEVRTEFDPTLPKVLGDSNQLLQVCMQLVGNGLHVMSEQGGSVLTIRTALQQNITVLQIITAPALSQDPETSTPSTLVEPGDGVALSACQGILHEHHGQILCQRREDSALLFRVELPAADFPSLRLQDSTAPVLWQSRPSV
jgi:signal transduction histidine kinase